LAKINVGPTSARDYLDQHVAPAYSRFVSVSDHANAISLAKALWDTAGWLWSDRHPGVNRRKQKAVADVFDADLFERCPDLKLIRYLADATKHGGELDGKTVTVKGISGSGSPGGTGFTVSPLGTLQSKPECTLQIDHEGGSRDMKEALTTAYKFLLAETATGA
jgi:hypothetical protein